MDTPVEELVRQKFPHLQVLEDGRVKCTLNGHVMPATLKAVQSFVSGSKFRRLEKRAEEESNFGKFEPFIIQSKNREEKLYCALTCMLINKSQDSLRKHMKGKAFLRAKGQFEGDKLELMEEPDFEESEASQSEQEHEADEELLEELEDMDLHVEPSLEPVVDDKSENSKRKKPKQKGLAKNKPARQAESKDLEEPAKDRGNPSTKGKARQKKKAKEPASLDAAEDKEIKLNPHPDPIQKESFKSSKIAPKQVANANTGHLDRTNAASRQKRRQASSAHRISKRPKMS